MRIDLPPDCEQYRGVFEETLAPLAADFPEIGEARFWVTVPGEWSGPPDRSGYTYEDGRQVVFNRKAVLRSNTRGTNGITETGKYSLKRLILHECGHVLANRNPEALKKLIHKAGGEEAWADRFASRAKYRQRVKRLLSAA